MNVYDLSKRQIAVVQRLTRIPRQLLDSYTYQNPAELVLGELCHQECFNVTRAAFFVDNPDFDCVRGIAGYDVQDHTDSHEACWIERDAFGLRMRCSSFNKLVRSLAPQSISRQEQREYALSALAEQLDFRVPAVTFFEMPHENKGLIVFERPEEDIAELEQLWEDACSLLAFCPLA
ncbi:MAG: hypothetical protein UV79_C0014G0006 [candidate division TM6 bacterium GW2011_GWF2_43_17]|nr:MAG: hypothetical protein UV79_C0014G0006 [candidate division TM6 bacterium GW2011_GWF2_43_17]HAU30545.1 hypothetical protein [Candidatus Dependentiae bacterium]